MEFGEKIKKLRTQKGMTQEQLAEKLYVSRTAVSKWESGRGYPNIDSLKDIAKLFEISIDQLLSSEELIVMAKKENTSAVKKTNSLMFGLLDIISVLYMLLPIYPCKIGGIVYSVPLLNATGVAVGIKMSYIIALSIMSLIGVVELVLTFVYDKRLQVIFNTMSIVFQVIFILLFALSRQAYLTSIVFVVLIIKAFISARAMSKKEHNN